MLNKEWAPLYLYTPSHVKSQEIIELEGWTRDSGSQHLDDFLVNTLLLVDQHPGGRTVTGIT